MHLSIESTILSSIREWLYHVMGQDRLHPDFLIGNSLFGTHLSTWVFICLSLRFLIYFSILCLFVNLEINLLYLVVSRLYSIHISYSIL